MGGNLGCIALAGDRFQARSRQRLDMTAGEVDQLLYLPVAARFGRRASAYAQYVGDRSLGNGRFIDRQSTHRQRQPAAQLLVERMV